MPKRSMISEIVEKISLSGPAIPSRRLSSGEIIASIASFKKLSMPLISPLTRVSIPQPGIKIPKIR